VSQPKTQLDLDYSASTRFRTLAIDAVQQANSGHPGAPMGLAPVVYSLWQKYLRYDPADPTWPNRDRFVLSAGHASMLLYATLHLVGVRAVNAQGKVTSELAVSMDEIKRFRQIDSRTPGHPNLTSPRESKRPLDRLAKERETAWEWRLPVNGWGKISIAAGFDIFDFNVYAVCGDGDLMEGVASEAASLRRPPEALEFVLDLR